MEERWHLIALHQIAGVGWHTMARLMENGWIPGEEIRPSLFATLKQSGVPKKVVERIQTKFHLSFIKQVKQECEERKITAITYFDPLYPSYLKEIPQPPWILYAKGDPGLLQTPCLAIVGARRPSSYGIRMTRKFAGDLATQGFTIVSGMAYGIDAEAHQSVLDAEGKTIAVLASGVDVIYPKRHRKLYDRIVQNGTVISESAPGTKPNPGLFPLRNRIISGLSFGTLVVEATKKSGSLITANYSVEQNREVFSIPGPIYSPLSEGTLQLIQEGAKCVKKIDDLLEELPPINRVQIPQQKMETKLNNEEKRLLSYIGEEPIQITTLIENVSKLFSIGQIHQLLLSLELKQVITQLAGQRYVRR